MLGRRLQRLALVLITGIVLSAWLAKAEICTGTTVMNFDAISTLNLSTATQEDDPALPLDLVLTAVYLTKDQVATFSARVCRRMGYPSLGFQARDLSIQIKVPECFDVVEGQAEWRGSLVDDEVAEIFVLVQAKAFGQFIVEAVVFTCQFPPYDMLIEKEKLYVLVSPEGILISPTPFVEPRVLEKGWH